jgi:putative ABC transport system permease protein
MIKDYFKLAIRNIGKRKLRSWLTLIGIFISIAVIFILISLSLGLQAAVQEQFRLLGTDKFFIQPSGQFGPPGTSTAVKFTTEDFEIVKKVSGVKAASYMVAGNAEIVFNKETKYFTVMGLPADGIYLYEEASSIEMDDGSSITGDEVHKVMIGYDFKYNAIFDKPVKTSSKILINNQEFIVRGIIGKIGNSQDDKNIIMGIEDFKELFNSGNRVDYIIVQISDGENINEVKDRVEKKLMNFRKVTEKTKDFTILTPEELLNSFQMILTIITSFLISIAAISLIVGGVGIANTMYTSVLERTKEIGIMKSIGAKNSDILLIFLIEAGFIGAIGGMMGVGIGIVVSKTVESIAINQIGTTLLRAVIPAYLVIGCIAFAFIIGAISGILPAKQASRIRVVDALRYE